jgi:hypothetical protein
MSFGGACLMPQEVKETAMHSAKRKFHLHFVVWEHLHRNRVLRLDSEREAQALI